MRTGNSLTAWILFRSGQTVSQETIRGLDIQLENMQMNALFTRFKFNIGTAKPAENIV